MFVYPLNPNFFGGWVVLDQDRSVVQVEYTVTVPSHEIEACCHKMTGVDRKGKKMAPGQRFSNGSPKPQGWVSVGGVGTPRRERRGPCIT